MWKLHKGLGDGKFEPFFVDSPRDDRDAGVLQQQEVCARSCQHNMLRIMKGGIEKEWLLANGSVPHGYWCGKMKLH